ncbi:MAG TPA: 2-oxo acid dehydrogenase subunit E2, partial [Chloroflexi bacterium]|nr:2-oxo acid dehydrogenase subunit E2 [Chloroflexota bacterium]
LMIKLVAQALRAFPYMNVRQSGDAIQEMKGIHIGLAVDTERGLLVPHVFDADKKGLVEIARDVRAMVERARKGKSLPDELTLGTFTITNLGMYEVDAFSPIINYPETAILGVGRIKAVPAVVDGEVVVRQRMWLSLTVDHRVVDGAPAARFLQHVKELIEDPLLLLA